MGHLEEQQKAREAKALRKAKLQKLESEQRFYAERRAKQMYVEIDLEDLKSMLLKEDLIPECESVEWLGLCNGGIRILCQK